MSAGFNFCFREPYRYDVCSLNPVPPPPLNLPCCTFFIWQSTLHAVHWPLFCFRIVLTWTVQSCYWITATFYTEIFCFNMYLYLNIYIWIFYSYWQSVNFSGCLLTRIVRHRLIRWHPGHKKRKCQLTKWYGFFFFLLSHLKENDKLNDTWSHVIDSLVVYLNWLQIPCNLNRYAV